jgi:hypothetical protein
MAVVVSSKVTESRSALTGDVKAIVIVYTKGSGYGPFRDAVGIGTVVATLCTSP